MDGFFSQLCVLGSSLMLLLGLGLAWRRRLRAYIAALRWQSIVLAGLIGLVGHFGHDRALYAVAILLFLFKGVAVPALLGRMARRLGPGDELAPYVAPATSLLISGLLVLFAYAVTRPLVAVSQLPTRAGMPLALALVFVSLLVVISRKKALTQVIGFLMLENGITLLAVLGTYGIPLLVELGVFLDALLGFLVMQIFLYQIHETFESTDVERLRGLRD